MIKMFSNNLNIRIITSRSNSFYPSLKLNQAKNIYPQVQEFYFKVFLVLSYLIDLPLLVF